MTYLSVCSGIEAATVAWAPLGFKPIGFAEIEPFPCELLKQKYPNVKNYGDITQYEKWNIGQFDILVGGTPCQSFSIAGKRGGTDDIRGQLMYSYLGIVEQCKPQWVIWENVPGVLSSNSGYDFASFLAGLEKCGYGWAYRVLDAQYFGVPQRRRRVFVVGHSDNRTDLASKVLFEPKSMQRDFKKGGEKQKKPAVSIGKGVDYFRRGGNYKYHRDKKASTLRNSASPDCFDLVLVSGKKNTGTLLANCSKSLWQNNQEAFTGDFFISNRQQHYIRRLTPLECERLQGFPDNYTQIEWKGKPKDQCPDSHRYKAIGNSMAVPVMRWIGERIKKIGGKQNETN
ncbi:DNA cytosine methyltransferase [Treponema putidum]|uniref:DNA cytosine methyltransferase n=1 Tax=Treponema putidum TaxID=221027 RepID=UPI002105A613|nr:DNA cytosine methyltransferase [Treponema putidum]UTY30504.1 DNA cytosine methyltransferase [Treponema putidum]